MTHEMRRATWTGLDGRAVVRPDRRPREEAQAETAVEMTSEPAVVRLLLPAPPESVED